VKIAENATDYSLMNTTRQALFLPVDRDAKYEGKTAIDTFFWRLGDLIQAGVVFVGLNVLGWKPPAFATVNLVLALAWIALAVAIGKEFGRKAQHSAVNVAPEAGRPIADLLYVPGSSIEHVVLEDAFMDADPGDVLSLAARREDGRPMPAWLRFDARRRCFIGTAPGDCAEEFVVMVIASDVDGLEATSSFSVRRVAPGG
jgi:AAA family ATP:ADP antiporter